VSTKKQVTLNGEPRSFPLAATLLDIVRELDLEPERLAIELNRAIVKRENWDAAVVESGSEIEVVQFVGGG
jgi:thiamine biosynthesis protein ThiS